MSLLDDAFLQSLAEITAPYPRFKWYISAIVGLAAMNYSEEISAFYTKLLESHIPKSEQLTETRKIREALTKMCGIHGAARTGSSLRALAIAVPHDLRDQKCYRKDDTLEVASARGDAFFDRIYGPNLAYDRIKTTDASPDYDHIVMNLFYGCIFSFDKILNDLETAQAVVSCLFGNDCQEQVANHMRGMMYNGAKKEEVQAIREIIIKLADRLDVKFRKGPIPVPDI